MITFNVCEGTRCAIRRTSAWRQHLTSVKGRNCEPGFEFLSIPFIHNASNRCHALIAQAASVLASEHSDGYFETMFSWGGCATVAGFFQHLSGEKKCFLQQSCFHVAPECILTRGYSGRVAFASRAWCVDKNGGCEWGTGLWRNVEGRAREAIHKQQAGQDETYRKVANAVKRRKQTRNSTQTFWIDYSVGFSYNRVRDKLPRSLRTPPPQTRHGCPPTCPVSLETTQLPCE